MELVYKNRFHDQLLPQLRRVAGGIGVVALSVIGISPTSHADEEKHIFPISFTGQYGGVYPRAEGSLDSPHVGEVLAEGQLVTVVCEYEGQEVTNSLGATSNIWEKLDDGGSVPNALVDTGYPGYTPEVSKCDPEQDSSVIQEKFIPYHQGEMYGLELLEHYYSATGQPVKVDWSFLQKSADFNHFLRNMERDNSSSRVFEPNPTSDPDILFAMGAFGVDRTSPGCYSIVNMYDFKPDKAVNATMYKEEYQAELDGRAQSFEMRASNCE